jgi:UPF0716 protein FxsA
MLAKLFALFTIVPLIELLLLIPLSQAMGTLPTIALVVTTAVVGAILGKSQGLGAWNRITTEFGQGKLPGDAIIDGLIVLVACVLLITPGVLTDVLGISMLIPFLRAPVRKLLKARWTNRLQNGAVTYIDLTAGGASRARPDDDVIDVTPVEKQPESAPEPSAQFHLDG